MTDLAPLIYDLALMLSVAGIIVLIFQRIQQPVVLGYLVAGMIIGPYTWPHNLVSDEPNIKTLSELGVIFLMFSLGLEFSFQKLTVVGFSSLLTGLFDVSLMMLLGYSAAWFMGWDFYDSLFLGAALSISSTTIIVKAINELNLKTKRFAEVIFGVLIVEDLLAILLLVALSTMVATKNLFSLEMLYAAGKLILVVGGWFLVGYFLVPSLFRRFAHYISQETLTIISVALCLFLVSLAASYHYSAALGAFIMGSILAETILVHRIEELITPLRDVFGAVFFISVGMLIDPSIIIEKWPVVLAISCVLIFGKITVISIGTFLTGQSLQTAVRAGFGMAQIGEFSFIIATLGLALNVVNHTLYPIIVAVSSLTTFTTPYMIRLSGKMSLFIEEHLPERIKYFFESYAAWVYRTQTSTQGNPLLRSVTMRFVVNGIIVAIIFTFIDKFAYPSILDLVNRRHNAKMLSEMLAIAISSPFIWGMVFSYKLNDIPEYAKSRLTPVVFLIWLMTLIEIIFLSVLYFHTWITTATLLLMAMIFFFISYRQLEKSYHWFERQLIKNIKRDPAKTDRYSALAPWETHLVEIDVSEKSIFIGKTLAESRIRQHYGVNIVAICHGSRILPAPRGEEKIVARDKLIVLGNDQQLDAFKNQIEVQSSV
ncbi:MAG: cation:proton antiporter, partial [Gammaproteobacteria bacterium]|nr:cation:proton antiporter [Gammaproteobacteria bacterium]